MNRLRRPPLALVVASGAAAWARRRPWLVYPALVAPFAALYLADAGPFGSAGVFHLIGLSAVAAIFVGSRVHLPGARMPWLLFALGISLFVTGDAIAYSADDLGGSLASLADWLYLAVYPCLV